MQRELKSLGIHCAVILAVFGNALAQTTQPGPSRAQQLQSFKNRVDHAVQIKELDSIPALASECEDALKANDKSFFGRGMLYISQALSTYDFGQPGQYGLSQKYAMLALDKGSPRPWRLGWPLLAEVQRWENEKGVALMGADWVALGSHQARLWLAAFHDLDAVIDPTWRKEKLPGANHARVDAVAQGFSRGIKLSVRMNPVRNLPERQPHRAAPLAQRFASFPSVSFIESP